MQLAIFFTSVGNQAPTIGHKERIGHMCLWINSLQFLILLCLPATGVNTFLTKLKLKKVKNLSQSAQTAREESIPEIINFSLMQVLLFKSWEYFLIDYFGAMTYFLFQNKNLKFNCVFVCIKFFYKKKYKFLQLFWLYYK